MKRLALLLLATACTSAANITRPFNPSKIQPPVAIAASADRAWSAAVGWFAEHNLPVKTIDKASGVLVVEVNETMYSNRSKENGDPANGHKGNRWEPLYADCGARDGLPYDPTSATYNVRVAGDASAATVIANVKYTQDGEGVGNKFFVCQSTGKWEADFVVYVKQNAQSK